MENFKRKAVEQLIVKGLKRKRALEIVGVTESDLATRSKKERQKRSEQKYRAANYRKNLPEKGVKPWRCPKCRKLIKIENCIYCRDRRAIERIQI